MPGASGDHQSRASDITSDWQVKGPHLHDALALQSSALEQRGDLSVRVIVAIAELTVGAEAPQPGPPVCAHCRAHLWACRMWACEINSTIGSSGCYTSVTIT